MRLLKKDMKDRIGYNRNFKEIKQHEWFKNGIFELSNTLVQNPKAKIPVEMKKEFGDIIEFIEITGKFNESDFDDSEIVDQEY